VGDGVRVMCARFVPSSKDSHSGRASEGVASDPTIIGSGW
jgi:hypothetical protein